MVILDVALPEKDTWRAATTGGHTGLAGNDRQMAGDRRRARW